MVMSMKNLSVWSKGKHMCPPVSVTRPVARNLIWFEGIYQGPLGASLHGRQKHRRVCACATNSKPLRYRANNFMLGIPSDDIFR